MTLRKKGKYRYGDRQADIRDELLSHSKDNAYLALHYADAVCAGCDGHTFRLLLDEEAGAAVRVCPTCGAEHAIGDSAEYLEDADIAECECPCGTGVFEITAGVALYKNSNDVKWLYLGCRCINCSLVACYGDWKNEFVGYQELLRRI